MIYNMKFGKILITGFAGFVSWHFVEMLYRKNINAEIYGIDVNAPRFSLEMYNDLLSIKFKKVDMTDKKILKEVFAEFKPDYVLHLAAYSSVAYSWKNPTESFLNNSNIFLNLLEEIKEIPTCKVLSVGSSEEYGIVTEEMLPIKETQVLNPISPYAVARVAQEMLSQVYVDAYGLNIVLTRSFNHIGPRQDERFVVPGFIKRIMDIKASGRQEGVIETGDISIVRDFVDVRDVVEAYYQLLLKGKSGEVYNICSGKGVQLSEIIELVAGKVGVKVATKVNEEYVRPRDNKIIIGTSEKIRHEIGWQPQIILDDTIQDMIDWRNDK